MTAGSVGVAGVTYRGAWTNRWVQPYESTFSWLQKYAWVNLADAREILRDLFGRRSPAPPQACADLACGAWIGVLSPPPGMPIRQGLLSIYGPHWPPRLARYAGPLRFCEPCLRDGYHSILFQIEGLARCPLHDVALLSHCPHCGCATVPFGLQTESFATPFHCVQCRRALAKSFDPCRWSFSSSAVRNIKRALGPLDGWLPKLSCYPCPSYDEVPLAPLELRGQWAESNEVVCFDIARRVVPFSPLARFGFNSRRPLTYRLMRTRLMSRKPTKTFSYQLTPNIRHSIYRSIRQHLLRTCLKSHRGCVHRVRDSVFSRTILSRREILHAPEGCPVGKAFVRWNLQYEEDVRDLHEETAGVSTFTRSRSEDADDVLWALETFAEFVCSAATELELELDSQEAQAPHDMMAVSMRLWPYLNLTHREVKACWDLEIDRDAGRHLILAGDLAILRELEVCGRAKCQAAKRLWRAQRARRYLSGAIIQAPPATGRRIRTERWSDDWVSPFESALFVLLKYLRANPQSASDLERLVFSPTKQPAEERLLWGRSMQKPHPSIAAGEALMAGTLGGYAPQWRCGVLTSPYFRFCPTCLKAGYHSVFYQIDALIRCPLHGTTLQTSCANCGAFTLVYQPTRIPKDPTYLCRECKSVLVSKDFVETPREMREHLREKLQPVAQWLAECERAIPFRTPLLDSPVPEFQIVRD